jgi:hypothetical protein
VIEQRIKTRCSPGVRFSFRTPAEIHEHFKGGVKLAMSDERKCLESNLGRRRKEHWIVSLGLVSIANLQQFAEMIEDGFSTGVRF